MLVATRGFGNGTQAGTTAFAVRRGYSPGETVVSVIFDTVNFILYFCRLY